MLRGRYTPFNLSAFNATLDHGLLLGLADDDHSQYLLADATRALTADWDVGNYDLTAKNFIGDGYGKFDGGISVNETLAGDIIAHFKALSSTDTVDLRIENTVAGKDAQLTWEILGADWCMGVDNSETNDPLVICFGTAIGAGVMATFDGTAGTIDMPHAVTATTYNGVAITSAANNFTLTGDTGSAYLGVVGALDLDAIEADGFWIEGGNTVPRKMTFTGGSWTFDQSVAVNGSPQWTGVGVGTAAISTVGYYLVKEPTASYKGADLQVSANPAAGGQSVQGLSFSSYARTSSEDMSNVIGIIGNAGVAINSSYTGTITNIKGLSLTVTALGNVSDANDPTVTNAYGIKLESLAAGFGGTIGTAYGLHLPNISTATTNWAIYSAGGDSYFAGNILTGTDITFDTSVDSSSVANEVSLGGYELSAGNRALAISQEAAVAVEVDETKFSHKLPVRINGSTYYIMLTAT
jgi:hypothetical protein